MKFGKSTLVSIAIIVVTFSACLFLRSVPVNRIWNSYTVVYVDKALSEQTVLNYLSKAGCAGVISLSSQKIPYVSDMTPVMPAKMNEYLFRRLGYFSDLSSNYALFYVPRTFDTLAARGLDSLIRDTSVSAGIDGKKQFPWLVPIITIVVFCLFAKFSTNRMPFAVASIFPICLSLSQVFYPVASACVLQLLSIYLAQRIWGRKKAQMVLKKNVYVLIPSGISILILMMCGWKSAVLVVLCVMSAFSSLLLLKKIQDYADSKKSFRPVKIFQAPQLPLMHPKTAAHTLMCLVPLLVILVVFVLSARFTTSTSDKSIALPIPVNENLSTGDAIQLPVLDDYFKWSWKARSFPYTTLNDANKLDDVQDGDTISILRYENTENGIVESKKVLMTYDENYRASVEKEIDSMENPAVEKLMKKQGSGVKVVYGRSGNSGQQKDGLSLVLILICLFVPIVLYAIYTFKMLSRNKK